MRRHPGVAGFGGDDDDEDDASPGPYQLDALDALR